MFIIFNTNSEKIKLYNAEDCIIFEDICNIKYLEDKDYILIIIDSDIDDNGVLQNYDFVFEEILITLNVKMIITNIVSEKLHEITDFYKIPLIELKK